MDRCKFGKQHKGVAEIRNSPQSKQAMENARLGQMPDNRGQNEVELWGGYIQCPDGIEGTFEQQVAVVPPLFFSKWHWRKPARVRRPISAVRSFEKDVANFLFISGDGFINFRSANYISHVRGKNFYCTKPDRAYFTEIQPDAGGTVKILHVMVPNNLAGADLSRENALFEAIPCSDANWELIHRLADDLFELGPGMERALTDIAVNALLNSIKEQVRSAVVVPEDRRASDERFKEIIAFVEDNLARRSLSAKIIADKLGISRRYLSLILSENGLHLPDLVKQVRIKAATRMIEEKAAVREKLEDIASHCGFSSYSSFYSAFMKQVGIPPAHYRRALERS
jgi:AraC-like DNA-binding protein